MAYHSLLNINFRGREEKGWVEVLIIGDSAQGKTETAMNLMRHYRLGEKVDCKNASVAGLIGGLQQLDKRWFATWGAIPTHVRRLVTLEELKGLSIEVISKLTEMRSSGRALKFRRSNDVNDMLARDWSLSAIHVMAGD